MIQSEPRSLTCMEAVELFSDFLDGALDEEKTALCEEHLRSCSGCLAYLDQLKITVSSLRLLAVSGLPEDVREELLKRFREFKAQQSG